MEYLSDDDTKSKNSGTSVFILSIISAFCCQIVLL